jgi:hypothetical protein
MCTSSAFFAGKLTNHLSLYQKSSLSHTRQEIQEIVYMRKTCTLVLEYEITHRRIEIPFSAIMTGALNNVIRPEFPELKHGQGGTHKKQDEFGTNVCIVKRS